MKACSRAIAAVLIVLATNVAEAQPDGTPRITPPLYPATQIYVASPHHASTVAESYARGYADVVRASGEYNLLTSQALVNLAEARRREIENRVAQTQAYFQVKEINRSYRQRSRAARSSRTVEKQDMCAKRIHEESKPQVVALHDGRITWPKALQNATFAVHRNVVEEMALRQVASGTLSDADRARFDQAHQAMVTELRERIHECSPQDYVDAKRFLTTLSPHPEA